MAKLVFSETVHGHRVRYWQDDDGIDFMINDADAGGHSETLEDAKVHVRDLIKRFTRAGFLKRKK